MKEAKRQVHDFWNKASSGEELYLPSKDAEGYLADMEARYALEPYIIEFARFNEARGLRLLEIGVGLGTDHQRFGEAGANLYGIDLTMRAVEITRSRFDCFGLNSRLIVGDAEALSFPDGSFDRVYSWGVIHHSPDTSKVISEIHRVLKDGGKAKIMIYNKWSMVGLMLWIRYALLRLRPWMTLSEIYASYLESPGTKAYTIAETRKMFSIFGEVEVRTILTHGDLLDSDTGQRHKGLALSVARWFWPRNLVRRFLPRAGLFMLIHAIKL